MEVLGQRGRVALWLGPLFFLGFLLWPAPEGLPAAAWWTAGAALLMATWWIGESIPIPATSLVPLVVFPLIGAGTIRETAAPYADPIIFLFLGGFLIALAMERSGLHRRIALNIIQRSGTGGRALVGGFMVAAAALSMWVSNTATSLMMLPVALSVAQVADDDSGKLGLALLLGLAYGCNIGGMGTLVGTPPNALMVGFLEQEYGIAISFVNWLGVGLPVVLLGLPLTYFVLTRVAVRVPRGGQEEAARTVADELAGMEAMTRGERRVAMVFAGTALLWITRPLLSSVIPGLSDAGIAMTGGLALFLIPRGEGGALLDWNTAKGLPWGALILFGGGLSLAGAFTRTGLSEGIGQTLAAVGALPQILILALLVALVIFLTELTSNAATTATMLPVLAAMAIGIGQSPLLLAVPAVLAASCAFMLPVATPPNAIVFGSGKVSVPQMARAGIWLNLGFIVLITALTYALVERVLV
ncbi:MAG: DASS family sodium-coupled anion symporter [Rhodothermales bacterium]|nr:DASS family sodium-coupled anion symporter [Rhodothermales bacterium]MBO6779979.1 DASS family sodium-coupled anion symporter [Rhodothermales bacterium]